MNQNSFSSKPRSFLVLLPLLRFAEFSTLSEIGDVQIGNDWAADDKELIDTSGNEKHKSLFEPSQCCRGNEMVFWVWFWRGCSVVTSPDWYWLMFWTHIFSFAANYSLYNLSQQLEGEGVSPWSLNWMGMLNLVGSKRYHKHSGRKTYASWVSNIAVQIFY